MTYNTAVIRELLTAAFSDGELTTFCYDYFRPVYENFAVGMSKGQKVQALIEHCGRTEQLPALLERVEAANSAQYARFEARLSAPFEVTPAPPDTPAPTPPRRRRRPRADAQERNPFRYLRPIPPEEFLGRWSLVKEIAWDLALEDGDSYACIGGRRFGKSSLLLALHHYLRTPEAQGGDHVVLPLLLDFKRHNFKSETAFFATVLHEVRRRVEAGSRGRPKDPYPVKVSLDGDWLDTLPTDDPPGLTLPRFEEALRYILDELYRADGPTRLVLLLDEVDDTLRYPWYQVLFGQLRSLIYAGDLADSVRLALAGSRRFLDEVSDRGSPLWNVLQLHYLAAFDQATTYELMKRALDLNEEAQQIVWRQSGGHPFLAQYLLHHLWKEGIAQADAATVAQVANCFLHEEQRHLESWAMAIGEPGLQVYGQLVDQPNWVEETELIRAFDDQNVPVKRALVDLCYHGFVIHDGEWNRYRYNGDLFRQWFLSQFQDQQKKGGDGTPLQSTVLVVFLFDIGRWAASELNERWKLVRQREGAEQPDEVDIAHLEVQTKQQAEALLRDLVTERGAPEVEQVVKLIERKRDLVAEWREMKVDNEEEYNRQMITRAALRIRQQELDERISHTMAEIEADLAKLGLQVRKGAVEW
jgi:hypothetical protein